MELFYIILIGILLFGYCCLMLLRGAHREEAEDD